ncbi:MAG: tRNA 2-thiouridine(34) synthase MnmA [Planctomycetota bacterium]
MTRVVVGMSGGVDSSLTAVLMRERGFDVVGVTMKLWPCAELDGGFTREDACCSPSETIDARAVAVDAGVPHYVLDAEEVFRTQVVDDFVQAYSRGETPNPCVRCNESVKFGDLWRYARSIGADAVSTGHYCRIHERDGRLCPGIAADPGKDQSYFLFSLSQEQLAHAHFPLGALSKDQVRAMAAERGLITADKRESQDICFIGADGVAGFLRREAPEAFTPGPIELEDGRVLGRHDGLAAYTIGQRKGLGVAWHEPLYVVALDLDRQAVVLGPRNATRVEHAVLRDCTWHLGPPRAAGGLRCLVRNRHRAPLRPATVHPKADGGADVAYDAPVGRPSPGQACVFYDLDGCLCLGGGWFIRSPVPADAARS